MPSAIPTKSMAPPAETPSGDPAITASTSTSTEPPTPTPGPRAAAFLQLYDKTLTTTLRTISYEAFSSCFPNLNESAPETLRAFHGQMIERLGGFAKADLDEILRERNVVENLNALEDLISDARRRKARAVNNEPPSQPPHLLPPATILSAHLAPTLTSSQSHLNARLQTLQSQNATLFTQVQEQWKEIEGLVAGLEGVVRDLEGAGTELTERAEEGRMAVDVDV